MIPGVEVYTRTDPGHHHLVALHHYEGLRDQLDRGEAGWVELEQARHPSGKAFLRLEDVTELVLVTAEVIEAMPPTVYD